MSGPENGTVDSYDYEQGFITRDSDGANIWFHFSALTVVQRKKLNVGDRVMMFVSDDCFRRATYVEPI